MTREVQKLTLHQETLRILTGGPEDRNRLIPTVSEAPTRCIDCLTPPCPA